MTSTPGTQIEDQLRERLARVVRSLEPLATTSGHFPDPRQLYLIVGMAIHDLEGAQWLAAKLLGPTNYP
jgi:hypothetical protein